MQVLKRPLWIDQRSRPVAALYPGMLVGRVSGWPIQSVQGDLGVPQNSSHTCRPYMAWRRISAPEVQPEPSAGSRPAPITGPRTLSAKDAASPVPASGTGLSQAGGRPDQTGSDGGGSGAVPGRRRQEDPSSSVVAMGVAVLSMVIVNSRHARALTRGGDKPASALHGILGTDALAPGRGAGASVRLCAGLQSGPAIPARACWRSKPAPKPRLLASPYLRRTVRSRRRGSGRLSRGGGCAGCAAAAGNAAEVGGWVRPAAGRAPEC